MNSTSLQLIGAPASPYTRKMLALLRFRRIPYEVRWGDPATVLTSMGLEVPKPVLLPTFLFSQEDNKKPFTGNGGAIAVCDSTPVIRSLEESYAQRSVIPPDPALKFLNYLVEDFADEWGTKYMFHYRWHAQQDIDNAGTLLPLMMDPTLESESLKSASSSFIERQTGRLYVVGSTPETAPIIDASYERFLDAMTDVLQQRSFLFGDRPSAADFALFGQMSQCVGLDPTPREITLRKAPRVVAWVHIVEDLCGLPVANEQWHHRDQVSANLQPLLEEIGRTYIPALLENARAYSEKRATWSTTIDGARWEQKTFPYQAKCLRWIREEFSHLDSDDQAWVRAMLRRAAINGLVD
ncbi:MAG: glutathione S-transferase N-terminal domain-containing protein [Pseudomonadota bacterium]